MAYTGTAEATTALTGDPLSGKDKAKNGAEKAVVPDDKLAQAGAGLADRIHSRMVGAARARTAPGVDLPDTKIVQEEDHKQYGIMTAAVLASLSADLTRFRRELYTSDLPAISRELKQTTGNYTFTEDKHVPPTIQFDNKDLGLPLKIKAALLEAKAANHGFYIEENGDRLLVNVGIDPVATLEKYGELEKRREASGVPYRVEEFNTSTSEVIFPDNVDPAKAIDAVCAEAKATRKDISLTVNGTYMGSVTENSNPEGLKRSYDETAAKNAAMAQARETATREAAQLKQELGYSMKPSREAGAVNMSLTGLPSQPEQLEKVIGAARAEALSLGKTVLVRVGDDLTTYAAVGKSSSSEDMVKQFQTTIRRQKAASEAAGFRSRLGYTFARQDGDDMGPVVIRFPADTTPEDRVQAAATKSISLNRPTSFSYDGVDMKLFPDTDPADAQAAYMAKWNAHTAALREMAAAAGMPADDLQLQARALKAKYNYSVTQSPDRLQDGFSATIEFPDPTTPLADKIQAGILEARARGAGFEFGDQGNRLYVDGDTNAAGKLRRYEEARERAKKLGYTFSEVSALRTDLVFPSGSNAQKMAAAALHEREARQVNIDIKEGDKFLSTAARNSTPREVVGEVLASQTSIKKSAQQQPDAQVRAVVLRKELGYTITKDSDGQYTLKIPKEVPVNKALDAAITEARANNGRIWMERDGATINLDRYTGLKDAHDRYDQRLAEVRSEEEAAKWRPIAERLQQELGFRFYDTRDDVVSIGFRADTSPEAQIEAAFAVAKARQKSVDFAYNGMWTAISKDQDPEFAKENYLRRIEDGKSRQQAKLDASTNELWEENKGDARSFRMDNDEKQTSQGEDANVRVVKLSAPQEVKESEGKSALKAVPGDYLVQFLDQKGEPVGVKLMAQKELDALHLKPSDASAARLNIEDDAPDQTDRTKVGDVTGAEKWERIEEGLKQVISFHPTEPQIDGDTVRVKTAFGENSYKFTDGEITELTMTLNDGTTRTVYPNGGRHIWDDSLIWQDASLRLDPDGTLTMSKQWSSGDLSLRSWHPDGTVEDQTSGDPISESQITLPNGSNLRKRVANGNLLYSVTDTGESTKLDEDEVSSLGRGTAGQLFPDVFEPASTDRLRAREIAAHFDQIVPEGMAIKQPPGVPPNTIDAAGRNQANVAGRPILTRTSSGTLVQYMPDGAKPVEAAQAAFELSQTENGEPVQVKLKDVTIEANNRELSEASGSVGAVPNLVQHYTERYIVLAERAEALERMSADSGGTPEEWSKDIFKLRRPSRMGSTNQEIGLGFAVSAVSQAKARPIIFEQVDSAGRTLGSFTVTPDTTSAQVVDAVHRMEDPFATTSLDQEHQLPISRNPQEREHSSRSPVDLASRIEGGSDAYLRDSWKIHTSPRFQAVLRGIRARPTIDRFMMSIAGEEDMRGLKAETTAAIEARMESKIRDMYDAGTMSEDVRDPEVLREKLGLTRELLRDLKPAERFGLADTLKGKLMAYGIAADLLPEIVSKVFGL